jgi:hypothetical protein
LFPDVRDCWVKCVESAKLIVILAVNWNVQDDHARSGRKRIDPEVRN